MRSLYLPVATWRCWTSSLGLALATSLLAAVPDIRWQTLSSKRNDLPAPPGGSTEQTGAVIGDFDGDGVNDCILSFRQKAPALVWYRRAATGWDPFVIERDFLTIEAGGAVLDIDGDGDLDVVFGGDYQSADVWWWENPAPNFDKSTPWKRHLIKKGGKTQHHDQVFGDFLGTGRPQLAFWNQQAKSLFLAEIPTDPRRTEPWPFTEIISGARADATSYTEGMSAFDVDGDGKVDLLAYNMWFKHTGGKNFKAIKISDTGGLIFAGYFKPSKVAQIVISPGDGNGPLRWYECAGDPENPKDWVGHDLIDRKIVHGHSLQLGDFNRDGHLDIFAAEMAKWGRQPAPDHPEATAWVFYGDGHGSFAKTELVKGHGWHEARLADLDGDGDLDLLNKPYTWDTPRVDVWLNNGTRAGAKGTGTSKSFQGPVGLQLYSLRDTFQTNVPLALQFAKNFGFLEVELAGTYGLSPETFREGVRRSGLKPVATHFSYEQWAKDPEQAAAEARALGPEYAGCAWIPHDGPFTEAKCREAIAVFNRAGEVLAKRGLKFFYHNHGYEFQPFNGGTLFDLLVTKTKPELVSFEMDLFWVVHPGQDPVKLLQKYPNRWSLLHLKDMKRGTATGQLTGSEDVRNDVALGTGQIDLAAAIREAQRLGVKHYFIEDESPAVIEQIPQSVRFLESLAW
jgi:sugar phosphate isomerase/epimerase